MSKIDELIQELCPEGVKFLKLDDTASVKRGRRVTKSELTSDGAYPVYSGGVTPMGYYDKFNQLANTITVVKYGTAGFVNFIEEEFWANDVCYCVKPNDFMDNKYLYYVLKDKQKLIQSQATDAIPAHLPTEVIGSVQIPIPPLEVQKEIVNILDKFTQLEAELSAELDARRKQYDYYRKRLFELDSSTRTIKLTEACQKITTGKLNANAKDEDGAFPFFTCDATPYRINTYAFDTEAILVSGNGSQVGHINYYKGKFNAYQRTYILSEFSSEVDVKYLLLYLNAFLRDYIYKHSKKGSVPYITLPMLQNFEIPLPNKADQLRIAEALGAFDNLVNNNSEGIPAEIKARRKQYEYYRTKLLTFQELSA